MTTQRAMQFLELSESRIFARYESDIAGEFYAAASGNIVTYLKKAPGKSSDIEDSLGVYLLDKGDCVLAVADGMGGAACGTEASRIAVQALMDAITASGHSETGYRETILTALETANQAVLGLGVGAGTTVAIAEISQGGIRPYHVGDSEVLVVGQRGKVKLQTISHSPVSYAVEAGILDEQEAIHHDERHLISNYLGAGDMRIEIGSGIKLARHDTVLLSSDGLFDNLHLEEIIEIIRKGNLRNAATQLITLLNERMSGTNSKYPSKPDDAGFILYRGS